MRGGSAIAGIPRYGSEAGAKSDTFTLSGAEDLVRISKKDGVTAYRPRTEGLFARIEHHLTPETDHWEVRSKDGLLSIYGTAQASQNDPAVIARPDSRAEIFSWKLTRTQDPFGNKIEYEYERDMGDTSEHHWDQLYLKRIRYAEYTDTDTNSPPVEKFFVSIQPHKRQPASKHFGSQRKRFASR